MAADDRLVPRSEILLRYTVHARMNGRNGPPVFTNGDSAICAQVAQRMARVSQDEGLFVVQDLDDGSVVSAYRQGMLHKLERGE